MIDALQSEQVREHGGLFGARDENVLESAIARPRQKWNYEAEMDVATLADGSLSESGLAAWIREHVTSSRPG